MQINPQFILPEENQSGFLNWLLNNPNNFSFWFPKIEHLPFLGVYIPKTIVIPVPYGLVECFFFEEEGDRGRIDQWIETEAVPKITTAFPKGKLFIKNGCFSNKFNFSKNCLVENRDVKSLSKHVSNIQYDSLCFDTGGNMELIVREWIEPEKDLGTIYNGMPLRPELRVFYDFDRKEILYSANYWDWDYCHEGICRHQNDAVTYKRHYPELLALLNKYTEKWAAVIDQALSTVNLSGQWSADFILEENRLILIDMAIARRSAYWDPAKAKKD